MPRHINFTRPAIRSSCPKRSNRRRVRLLVLEDRTTPVTFADAVAYQTEGNPSHLATADLDGDGDLDVVFTSPSGVNTFQNDGKGALSNLVTLGVGGIFPSQVAIGDLTGDGKPDLVVGVTFNQRIAIFKGNGNGTFQAPILQEIGINVENLTIADFNGDGKTDIAFTTNSSGMGVLINNGSANVVGAPSYFLPDAQSTNACGITAADFNGDGFADVAYIDHDPGNKERLTLFISKGNGTFSTTGPAQTGAVLAFYQSDVIAMSAEGKPLDFNSDGKVDLAIGYGSNGFVGVFLGNGDGTFQTQNTFSTDHPAAGFLAAADFDQDGKLDISVSVFNSGKSGVPILLGDGKGNLSAPSLLSTFFDQNSIQAADLNADGFPDLLTTLPQSPGTVNVFLNTTSIIPEIAKFDIFPSFGIVPAGNAFGVTITARDQTGALYKGYTGTVHISASALQGILPDDYTFLPGENGVHTFNGVVLKTAGNQSIFVNDTKNTLAKGTTTVAITPAAASSIAIISGSPQSVTVNGPFALALTAKVTDVFGNGVPGTTVTIAPPPTSASATFASGLTLTTDANGLAAAVPSANTVAGSYNVTFSVTGVTPAATFSLTNNPGPVSQIGTVSGDSQTATVNTSFGSPLIARLTDAFGNAVSGATVTFAAPASQASATFPGGATVVSNSLGQVSALPTANTKAGSYSVTASVNGLASTATFSLTNRAGLPTSIIPTAGSGQSTVVNSAFSVPLTALVADTFGNGVPARQLRLPLPPLPPPRHLPQV